MADGMVSKPCPIMICHFLFENQNARVRRKKNDDYYYSLRRAEHILVYLSAVRRRRGLLIYASPIYEWLPHGCLFPHFPCIDSELTLWRWGLPKYGNLRIYLHVKVFRLALKRHFACQTSLIYVMAASPPLIVRYDRGATVFLHYTFQLLELKVTFY